MRTPPEDVADADVLAAVQARWEPGATSVEYLRVGFGAHHWRARVNGGPDLFVTLDELDSRRGVAELAAAYRAAAELAHELPFVHAGVPPWAVELPRASGTSALSVTTWLDGVAPVVLDRTATVAILERVHAVPAPHGIPRWHPLVSIDFADALTVTLDHDWDGGPFGADARSAVRARTDDIRQWTSDYHALGNAARSRQWVPTHGEPGIHNQLRVDGRLVLIDWESLRLAPAERDTRTVGTGDPEMLRLFDLEWRLDEIAQYADWFRGPHGDGEDDRIAFAGLLEELERP